MSRDDVGPLLGIAGDERGTVRVVVGLVGTRHRPVKGNRMRVITVRDARVSHIALKIQRALKGEANAKVQA